MFTFFRDEFTTTDGNRWIACHFVMDNPRMWEAIMTANLFVMRIQIFLGFYAAALAAFVLWYVNS